MLLQFIEIGVYKRNDEHDVIVYDVIVKGGVVKTCRKFQTALLELASELDKLVEPF